MFKHKHINQNNDRGRHFELSYVFATSLYINICKQDRENFSNKRTKYVTELLFFKARVNLKWFRLLLNSIRVENPFATPPTEYYLMQNLKQY